MNHVQAALLSFTNDYVCKLGKRIEKHLKDYREALMRKLPEDPESLQNDTKIALIEKQSDSFLRDTFVKLLYSRVSFYSSDMVRHVFSLIPEVIEKTAKFKEAKRNLAEEWNELDARLDLEYRQIEERAEELKLEIISTPEYTPGQALTMRNKIKGELEQLCRIPEQSQ